MINVRLIVTKGDVALDGDIYRSHVDQPIYESVLIRVTRGADLDLEADKIHGYQFSVVEGSGKFTLCAVDPSTGEPLSEAVDYDTATDGSRGINYPFRVKAPARGST